MKLSDFYQSMAGFTPVNSEIPTAPVAPNSETQVGTYLRTTLPLPLQYSGDTVKQYNRPGLSSFRIAPLAPNAIAASIAAAASTAVATLGGVSDIVSISLFAPKEFIVTGSPADATGTFRIAWAPEAANTFLAGPAFSSTIPSLPAYDQSDAVATDVAATSFTLGPIIPRSANEWAIAAFNIGATPIPPTGWTVFVGSTIFDQQYVGSGPIGGTWTGTSSTWAGILTTFQTMGTVNLINSANSSAPSGNTLTVTMSASANLGDTLIAVLTILGAVDTFVPTIADTFGNVWSLIASVFSLSGTRTMMMYAAQNIKSGPGNAVTVTRPTSPFGSSSTLQIMEVSGLLNTTSSPIPTFRKIVKGDINTIAVTSLNGEVGDVSLISSDSSVTITPVGQTIDLMAAGGGVTSVNTQTGAIVIESLDGSISVTTPTAGHVNLEVVHGGLPVAVEINGVGVSPDKQFFINGVSDGSTIWSVSINGTPDGG
jgi:hypothetical protein